MTYLPMVGDRVNHRGVSNEGVVTKLDVFHDKADVKFDGDSFSIPCLILALTPIKNNVFSFPHIVNK